MCSEATSWGPKHRKTVALALDVDAMAPVRVLFPQTTFDSIDDVFELRPGSVTSRDEAESDVAEIRVWIVYSDAYSGVRRGTFRRYRHSDVESLMFDETSLGRGDPSGVERPMPHR